MFCFKAPNTLCIYRKYNCYMKSLYSVYEENESLTFRESVESSYDIKKEWSSNICVAVPFTHMSFREKKKKKKKLILSSETIGEVEIMKFPSFLFGVYTDILTFYVNFNN